MKLKISMCMNKRSLEQNPMRNPQQNHLQPIKDLLPAVALEDQSNNTTTIPVTTTTPVDPITLVAPLELEEDQEELQPLVLLLELANIY
jgi:hypothetical protein